MSDREAALTAFISASGWEDANIAPLAGDASNRRYLRLRGANRTAVLMDAPPEKGEDVVPFIHIAAYLNSVGLSAPQLIAADEENGLLLLEDLGDTLFARVIKADPSLENHLYSSATQLLAELHRHAPPRGLAAYETALMSELSALAYDWYLAHGQAPDATARDAARDAISEALSTHAPEQSVLIQRDYHSENLLWLPDRIGHARVGLLDFQDAMLGHPAYDLVSLLQDARRDVAPAIEAEMIAQYVSQAGVDAKTFDAAYHTLGTQRNLRILGVFARLCLRDGKAHYIDLIPRVWGLLQRDLAHPCLAALSDHIKTTLPEPTPALLQKLKDKCATIPGP